MRSNRAGILVFAIFWSAILSVFLGHLVWAAFQQLKTLQFASAPGVIQHIERTIHSSSDGSTYGIDVRYTFDTGGRSYTGTRRRYGQIKSSDNFALQFVKGHPVGTPVTVYYHPANPADAVLVRGLESADLFMALFFVPFVCVAAGLWGAILPMRGKGAIAGLRVIEEGDVVRLRPSLRRVGLAGLVAAGIAAFLMIFLIGFSKGIATSMTVLAAAHGVWIFGAAAVMGVAYAQFAAGTQDIVFDGRRKELLLPKRAAPIPYQVIRSIDSRQVERRDSDGSSVTQAVVVRCPGSEETLYGGWLLSAAEAGRLAAYAAMHVGCETAIAGGGPAAAVRRVKST